jgi:hypothetical protein
MGRNAEIREVGFTKQRIIVPSKQVAQDQARRADHLLTLNRTFRGADRNEGPTMSATACNGRPTTSMLDIVKVDDLMALSLLH